MEVFGRARGRGLEGRPPDGNGRCPADIPGIEAAGIAEVDAGIDGLDAAPQCAEIDDLVGEDRVGPDLAAGPQIAPLIRDVPVEPGGDADIPFEGRRVAAVVDDADERIVPIGRGGVVASGAEIDPCLRRAALQRIDPGRGFGDDRVIEIVGVDRREGPAVWIRPRDVHAIEPSVEVADEDGIREAVPVKVDGRRRARDRWR